MLTSLWSLHFAMWKKTSAFNKKTHHGTTKNKRKLKKWRHNIKALKKFISEMNSCQNKGPLEKNVALKNYVNSEQKQRTMWQTKNFRFLKKDLNKILFNA